MKNEIPTKKRASSYVRVASTDETEQRAAIARQLQACYLKAKALGAEVVAEYLDLGESARSLKRPGLQALLRRLVGRRDIDHVIVSRVDRVARSINEQARVLCLVETAGASLVPAPEADDPVSDRFERALTVAVGHLYQEQVKVATRPSSTSDGLVAPASPCP